MKPVALVSVLALPALSVSRRVWPAGTSPVRLLAPVEDERVRSGGRGGQLEGRPGQDERRRLIVPPW